MAQHCVGRVNRSVLLPEAKRVYRIPTGTDAIGQANTCYPLESDGSSKRLPWMKRAIDYVRYFKGEGFAVADVSKRECYDVCCTKNSRKLLVEVKTTTTSGEEVVLTRREADMKGNRALFIVHSVTLVRGKAKGGVIRIVRPWRIDRKRLTPVSYLYTVQEN